MIYDVVGALVVFVLALAGLTFVTAYVADVTGHFRTLFVTSPCRQIFCVCRWVAAMILALLALLTIVE